MRALYIFFFFIFTACAHTAQKLCDHIEVREGHLSLSGNEKILICGSPKSKEGWRHVPLPQAQHQLSIYLGDKGFLNPRFSREGDQLIVWSGPQTKIHHLEVQGASGELLDPSKKRKIVGYSLEPSRLDEVHSWADTRLRYSGYACPQVSVHANAWNGNVVATVDTGLQQKIASLQQIGLDSFEPSALSRYQAFNVGELYDARKTQLTVARMLADGLIQSANFEAQCRQDQVALNLRASVGPPRIFRFEVGASTEEFPFGRVSFKNVQLDNRASSFTAQLDASPRLQSLSLVSQLYWIPWSAHSFLGPRARVGRVKETAFEYLEAKVGADLGRAWDWKNIRWSGRLGPTLNFLETVQGVGPSNISYLSWEGSLEAMSHNYESQLRTQFEGWTGFLRYRGQRKGLGSQINVNRYDFSYKGLWNVGQYAPPFLVVAARWDVNAVDADEPLAGQNNNDLVPIEYRVFYGGAENLRGFARKSLSYNEFGYMMGIYGGLELRIIEQLPWKLEPFLLYDIARLGIQRINLDNPLFVSSGFGMRWASPFGTLRGSAAKGKIYNEDATTAGYAQEWVYFLSFGQEF